MTDKNKLNSSLPQQPPSTIKGDAIAAQANALATSKSQSQEVISDELPFKSPKDNRANIHHADDQSTKITFDSDAATNEEDARPASFTKAQTNKPSDYLYKFSPKGLIILTGLFLAVITALLIFKMNGEDKSRRIETELRINQTVQNGTRKMNIDIMTGNPPGQELGSDLPPGAQVIFYHLSANGTILAIAKAIPDEIIQDDKAPILDALTIASLPLENVGNVILDFSDKPLATSWQPLDNGEILLAATPARDMFARPPLWINYLVLLATIAILSTVLMQAFIRQSFAAKQAINALDDYFDTNDAMENGRCCLWSFDADTRKVSLSRSILEPLGLGARDRSFSLQELASLIHPKDLQATLEIFTGERQDGKKLDTSEINARLRRSGGGWSTILIRTAKDTSQDKKQRNGIVFDITGLIFEQTRNTAANQTAPQIATELLSKGTEKENQRRIVAAAISSHLSEKKTATSPSQNNTPLSILTKGALTHDKQVGHSIDKERSLSSSPTLSDETSKKLLDAIETIPDAFILWDNNGKLICWNRRFATLFKIPASKLQRGLRIEDVSALSGTGAEIIKKYFSPADPKDISQKQSSLEVEVPGDRWVHISRRQTREGDIVCMASNVTDVKRRARAYLKRERHLERIVADLEKSRRELSETTRNYAFEKRRAEEASRSKSEFLANMSHELRTPLNAINGFSEVMQSELYGALGSDKYKEYITDIHNSGKHLLELIDDILDMSRIEAGRLQLEPQRIELERTVKESIRLITRHAEEGEVSLITSVSNIPTIWADVRATKQIILNLLSNAIKFTHEGGNVTLSTQSNLDSVSIIITDTGTGIEKDKLQKLGSPFEMGEQHFAKNKKGSGLGLALSKSLMELQDGILAIVSKPGKGTIACATFPRREGAKINLPEFIRKDAHILTAEPGTVQKLLPQKEIDNSVHAAE